MKLLRSVNIKGMPRHGKEEAGYVIVNETTDFVQVYVSSNAVRSNRLPGKPLADKLTTLLNIPKRRAALLCAILTTEDMRETEYVLGMDGIDTSGFPPEDIQNKVDKPNNVNARPVETRQIAKLHGL